MRSALLNILCCLPLVSFAGCSLILPEISHKPVIRNPFPQLTKIAIAPFFNHSDESTVDGRDFAMAYFSELQMTPGFEVVPLGIVEEAIIANQINLSGAGEARRLAQLLGVDAVVIGAVTDYSPYYPPRCGMRVEWYTANPGYHEIPAGYGLPWNTPEEEYIPDSLVYESQMALARAQMATEAPDCDAGCQTLPTPPSFPGQVLPGHVSQVGRQRDPFDDAIELTQATEELPPGQLLAPALADDSSANQDASSTPAIDETAATNGAIVESESFGAIGAMSQGGLCDGGLLSPTSQCKRPNCDPHYGPVLKHTRVYSGTDPDFTQALESYVYFRTDKRFGGWESYLQRSEDFVRFCCHMHISEMLSARGGSRKTRVVWRWPENR